VSRETKVLIGVGGLAAIGLILALSGRMSLGLLVLAIGLVAGFVGLRVTRPDTSDPFADVRSEADQTHTGDLTSIEPLTPWAPEGGLSAWAPPVDLAPLAPVQPSEPRLGAHTEPPPVAPAFEAEPATSWNGNNWDSTVTWEADPPASVEPPSVEPPSVEPDPVAPTSIFSVPSAPATTFPTPGSPTPGVDTNPLDELERIEDRESAAAGEYTGFTPFDAPVNENVTGADDIMAASHATELNLADGEQTELQKLLAKVQIRLSAYE
jgi:hypothetical protein